MPDIDTSPAALREWPLGAMNDGLFIIDAPPRPSTDDIVHDREDGPTMILNVTDLPEAKAQAIVNAHNAAIDGLRASLAAVEKERDAALRLAVLGATESCRRDVPCAVAYRLMAEHKTAEERAEKAEAERDAARWQPIETAPRDGTRLWCFWPDAEPEERQAIGWFVSYGEDEYWTDAADSDPNPPTHWMPLPAAPDQPEDPAHD